MGSSNSTYFLKAAVQSKSSIVRMLCCLCLSLTSVQTASLVDLGISAFTEAYGRRFESIFPLPPSSGPSKLAFTKALTANLLGGIGYFYGNSIVDRAFSYEWDEDDEMGADEDPAKTQRGNVRYTEPRELLTATPSRSFFPRGFYW